jgi:hypothetical protein
MRPATGTKTLSRRKRALFVLALLAFSAVIALVAAEIVLRLFPIPGITYHSFAYDPITGGKRYPHTTLMFRGDDGVLVVHKSNAWGYPDVEHETEAPPGTLRIGFFGDSYTEALQVPLESAFFRLIEHDLNARVGELAGLRGRDGAPVTSVETLAFGMSGRGALQSYLETRYWMRPLDLDYVVYVFCENDPADQIRRLKGSDGDPYPLLEADSFVVDDSFHDRYGYKTSWWHRATQRIKSNSLVVSTIEGRLKLLKAYGVKPTVTEADREGAATGISLHAPSAWPPELVPVGWELQERVTDRWRKDVEADGRKFVIMHVPRGEGMVAEPLETQDTWAPRLHRYCRERGIPLVDPTPQFLEHMQAGEKMYHHHFTPDGHRAFAESFVQFLIAGTGAPPSASRP